MPPSADAIHFLHDDGDHSPSRPLPTIVAVLGTLVPRVIVVIAMVIAVIVAFTIGFSFASGVAMFNTFMHYTRRGQRHETHQQCVRKNTLRCNHLESP
jgi:hypothetical protein